MDEVGGTVPSMTSNCSHGTFLVVFFQSDEVEVREEPWVLHDSALCRRHGQRCMVGDAFRTPRTPRSMPAACSLTRRSTAPPQ